MMLQPFTLRISCIVLGTLRTRVVAMILHVTYLCYSLEQKFLI